MNLLALKTVKGLLRDPHLQNNHILSLLQLILCLMGESQNTLSNVFIQNTASNDLSS